MNLLDFMKAMAYQRMTKFQFGKIMHSDEYSEEDKKKALKELAAAGGYEHLDE
nr:MAG: hypothetical protein [Bacteriophage sp.]